ncbi:ATP-binding protein [Pelagibacteraceae bacterium]|jgi:two-component system, OmpR family, osmolarity sensor histidine kinase EnvZ|nr:ATP-binding protein [Pelagibacteraceae bacterium]MDC0530389.1 ATP-binding protein [Pelagibacteraceae bacterium]MDC0952521.1 ATP-binding protein [Pelagibacteraceae bacterium]
MFSGLNRILKIILPKRLFYRALIIVAAPTIFLQLIIAVVFYDSIWIKVNKNITRSLVSQLKAIQEVYQNDKKNLDFFTDSYKNNFNFEIGINQNIFPESTGERRFSPMDRSLRRELKSVFGNNNYWFNTSKFKNAVEIKIRSENEIIEFLVPKEMVSASSVRLFLLWTILPSLVLLIIALIYLKNQTRPLVKLAKAAERFGKGDYVNNFRPSGALEIRKAAYEFDRMAKRINRHLNQRSEMLSGISHDLRTPLTRLKLQLAMLNQKDLSTKMSKDIDEMEKMLNNYLQFAKSQTQEKTSKINLANLFNEIKNNFNDKNLKILLLKDVYLNGRYSALKRSFENIIQNGITYGKKVYIDIQRSSNRTLIIFEDEGPGIPEDQYKNVFKPFFRIDKSRSLNQSGVGLGLAIVEDIINSHGGNIQLGKSKYNGLLVKISLPF